MTLSQEILLILLSKSLFARTPEFVDGDWLEVLKEAKNQAVVQLAAQELDYTRLSIEESQAWEKAASADLANSVRIGYNHRLLHEWMTSIPYVILKGAASASYYPTPVYRSMGDVDFLVKTEDLERAGKVLEEHGLKPWDQDHISHIVYRGPQMHYEMHFNIAGIPNGDAGDLVREYTKDLFQKTETKSIVSGVATLPSHFYHGLILLLHICHHLTGEGVGLRHLCDWAVFENSFSEDEFRELFEVKLKKLGLWRFAQILTRISIKYLGADERSWAIPDIQIVDALMDDILAGGNFGKKDKERSNQAYIISSRGKNGVGKTNLCAQFFISLNNVVYTRWNFAKKWKIVLPVGWLYFGIKHAVKIVKGERKKVHLSKMIRGAEKRRSIYKNLCLFECEV